MRQFYTILTFVCFFIFSQGLISAEQDVLILKNNHSGKTKILLSGDIVELYCDCGGYNAKGPLTIISDSSIAINTDTFPLSVIEKIKIQPTLTRVTGEICISVGVLFTVGGIIEGTQSEVFSDIPVGTYLTSGFAMNAAGIILTWIRKEYSNHKWTYQIGPIPTPKKNKTDSKK